MNLIIGDSYSYIIVPTLAAPPYIYTLISGSVPVGMTLDLEVGKITGTPTVLGTYNFTLYATSLSSGCCGTASFELDVICPALQLLPATLTSPDFISQSYDVMITASGGQLPYIYTVTSGSLPSGLTLNTASGLISGSTEPVGSFNFIITATDLYGCIIENLYQIVIQGCVGDITLSPTLSEISSGQPYSEVIQVFGSAVPPYTFSIISGSLPPGLTLNTSSGEISGIP